MLKNYLIKFYAPEGNSQFKNILAKSSAEAKSIIIKEGYMPVFAFPNIFLNIFKQVYNAGMKDKELSLFFMELYQLTKSTGSVSKSLNYMMPKTNNSVGNGIKSDKANFGEQIERFNVQRERLRAGGSQATKATMQFINNNEDEASAVSSKAYINNYGIKNIIKILLTPFKWSYDNHKRSKLKNRVRLIDDCISLLDKGETLKEIFALNNFEEIILSMLDLAASTGDYPQAFLKISEYFDVKNAYKKSITGALAYPAFLFFLLFIAFLIFLYYIIPTFASFFSEFPHIPASTLYILGLFGYLKKIFIYCVIFATLIFAAISLDLLNIKTRTASFILSIPTIRNIIYYGYLNWIFYQFSLMLSSGITVNAIFDYFRRNTFKEYFKNKFNLIYDALLKGITLRDSIANADFLPDDVVESIGYAEIGGFLSETVLKISHEFKEKANRHMTLFTKGLFFLAMVSVVFFLFVIFFSLFLPLIQGMVSLPANY